MNNSPHNIEIEQAVLGSILAGQEVFPHIGNLKPEHFYESFHARIFDTALSMFSKGETVSLLGLQTAFQDDNAFKQLGGMEYFARLVAGAATKIQLEGFAKTLIDLAMRRAVIDISLNMMESAGKIDRSAPFTDEYSEYLDELTTIFAGSSGKRKSTWAIDESGAVVVDKLAHLWENNGVDPDAVKTGLGALDRLTGGFKRHEFTIIAGRPGMGKTAVAIQMAVNAAQAGRCVAYFSLEMAHDALTRRAISSLIWTPTRSLHYNKITNCRITEPEFNLVYDATEKLAGWPLIIEDITGPTASEIEAKARVIKSMFERQGKTLDVIFVDHLHLMHSKTARTETDRYSHISTGLAEMGKRLGCAVVGLAQLSRQLESREDKRPILSDLRQSGTLEQDADAVIFCYREEYYASRALEDEMSFNINGECELKAREQFYACQNTLELIVAKQRNGPTGTADMFCDIASNVIRDTDQYHRETRGH